MVSQLLSKFTESTMEDFMMKLATLLLIAMSANLASAGQLNVKFYCLGYGAQTRFAAEVANYQNLTNVPVELSGDPTSLYSSIYNLCLSGATTAVEADIAFDMSQKPYLKVYQVP